MAKEEKAKINLKSTYAFIIYVVVLCLSYLWATFWKDAPFLAFATQLTLGFGLYIGRRLARYHKSFNNYEQDLEEYEE